MQNKNTVKAAIALIFLIAVISLGGCAQPEEVTDVQEAVPSGILSIQSSPAAQVYMDNEFKGESPLTLYNVPAGQHEVVLRKEGYADFESTVKIAAGRTEELEAVLESTEAAGNAEQKPAEEAEKLPETVKPGVNKINLSKFAMYFDFDKKLFTDLRTEDSDIFSRKYNSYIHFTAFSGAKIKAVKKTLKDTTKEDCASVDSSVGSIYSGQTLCVKTQEGTIVALGGSWEGMPTELEWAFLD